MKTFLDYSSKFLLAFALIFFFYGILKYSDMPIRLCGENTYCGKQGQSHTVEDYEAYNRWLIISSVSIPSTIILGLISNRSKKRNEREQ